MTRRVGSIAAASLHAQAAAHAVWTHNEAVFGLLRPRAGRIVLRDEALRTRAGFVSRSRGEQTVTQLESLRNNLAHSQDIVGSNWDTIVKLTENLDKFVGRSP